MPKNIRSAAVLAKIEATSGQGAALSATTDYIAPQPGTPPEFQISYAFDGVRGSGAFTGAQQRPTTPAGKRITGNFVAEVKGLGATYTATAKVPNIDVLLLAAGFSGSLSGGTWTYTYRAVSNTNTSAALQLYKLGILTPVSGAVANFGFEAEAGKPVIATFELSGLAGTQVDVAYPSFAESGSTIAPPVFSGATLSMLGYSSPTVRKISFSDGGSVSERLNGLAPNGHGGYVKNFGRQPQFTVTMETEAIATFDGPGIWQAGTTGSVSLAVGSATNNKFTFALNRCTITNIAESAADEIGLSDVTFTAFASDSTANDDVTITFPA